MRLSKIYHAGHYAFWAKSEFSFLYKMEQTLVPDPANDIYVRCESGDETHYIKLNRENLHYYLPETQRLLGGRNAQDSTYKDRPCFHLSFADYQKIAYVYIDEPTGDVINKFVKIKISRNLLPLMKTDFIFDGLQYYNTCFIRQLLKKYPPMNPTYDGFNIQDDELKHIIKQVAFPYDIRKYYRLIKLSFSGLVDKCLRIHSPAELEEYPWLRKYPRPVTTLSDGYYGDMNIVYAQKGTFGKVNMLQIDEDTVKFEYADILKLYKSSHSGDVNC